MVEPVGYEVIRVIKVIKPDLLISACYWDKPVHKSKLDNVRVWQLSRWQQDVWLGDPSQLWTSSNQLQRHILQKHPAGRNALYRAAGSQYICSPCEGLAGQIAVIVKLMDGVRCREVLIASERVAPRPDTRSVHKDSQS